MPAGLDLYFRSLHTAMTDGGSWFATVRIEMVL
jgi:hypothetical protein